RRSRSGLTFSTAGSPARDRHRITTDMLPRGINSPSSRCQRSARAASKGVSSSNQDSIPSPKRAPRRRRTPSSSVGRADRAILRQVWVFGQTLISGTLCLMRILVTGSSGQIGTNLALRLVRDGHEVFGVGKRLNPWVENAFPTLLQDLAGHYAAFPGGINGVEYPDVDLVVHLAAHAKVHQLVRQPHRALENAIMTFNVLEYARGRDLPIIFSSS